MKISYVLISVTMHNYAKGPLIKLPRVQIQHLRIFLQSLYIPTHPSKSPLTPINPHSILLIPTQPFNSLTLTQPHPPLLNPVNMFNEHCSSLHYPIHPRSHPLTHIHPRSHPCSPIYFPIQPHSHPLTQIHTRSTLHYPVHPTFTPIHSTLAV